MLCLGLILLLLALDLVGSVASQAADGTLDSVSELSSFQAEYTDYYSASPVGTVASSNDTVLDMEMSELMNLVSHDYSGQCCRRNDTNSFRQILLLRLSRFSSHVLVLK